MTTILVADDHPIVLEGLIDLFDRSDYSVVAWCRTGEEVLHALEEKENQPDILLLDVNMPPPSGLEIARKLKEERSSVRTVLLTSSIDDVQALEAIDFDVNGLVLKESAPRQLMQCLDAVRAGDQWIDPQIARRAISAALTLRNAPARPSTSLMPRELDVIRLVARGLPNKEISRQLGITDGTVKMYLHKIYEKLNVGGRVELTKVARERGLV